MALPVVLFLHRDPVVHELVAGTLGDEFDFVNARSRTNATKLAATHLPAVVLVDTEGGEADAAAVVNELRARDPHLRAIFFADAREPGKAWLLADLGTVLPKSYDLERLRIAIRKAAKMHAMSSGVEKLKSETEKTTKRIRPTSGDGAATTRLNYVKRVSADREAQTRPEPGKPRKAGES